VALALFELIDDLRDKILALHGDQIFDLLRQQLPRRRIYRRGLAFLHDGRGNGRPQQVVEKTVRELRAA